MNIDLLFQSKQSQVDDLIARADQLASEQKTHEDMIVYEAMAESLSVAWKELNRQLELRGYILNDTMRFYQLAQRHDQLVKHLNSSPRHALASQASTNVTNVSMAQSADLLRESRASLNGDLCEFNYTGLEHHFW